MKKINAWLRIFFATLLISATAPIGLPGAAEIVPEKILSVMLVKAVGYVKTFDGKSKDKIVIGVLGGGAIVPILETAAGKTEGRIAVKPVNFEMPGMLKDIDVLFFPADTPPDAVTQGKRAAVAGQVMTAGGDPQFIADRLVTLSFELVDNKPRILIDIESGNEEGVKFSPKLLKIADLK